MPKFLFEGVYTPPQGVKVGSAGMVTTHVIKPLTVEQIDAAVKMSPLYNAPGPTA